MGGVMCESVRVILIGRVNYNCMLYAFCIADLLEL